MNFSSYYCGNCQNFSNLVNFSTFFVFWCFDPRYTYFSYVYGRNCCFGGAHFSSMEWFQGENGQNYVIFALIWSFFSLIWAILPLKSLCYYLVFLFLNLISFNWDYTKALFFIFHFFQFLFLKVKICLCFQLSHFCCFLIENHFQWLFSTSGSLCFALYSAFLFLINVLSQNIIFWLINFYFILLCFPTLILAQGFLIDFFSILGSKIEFFTIKSNFRK